MTDLYHMLNEKEKKQARLFYEEVGFMNSNIINHTYVKYFVLIKDLELIFISYDGTRYIIDINPKYICRVRETISSERNWRAAWCSINNAKSIKLVGNETSIKKLKSRFKYINNLLPTDIQKIANENTYNNTNIREKSVDFEENMQLKQLEDIQLELQEKEILIKQKNRQKNEFIKQTSDSERRLKYDDQFSKLMSNYVVRTDRSDFWSGSINQYRSITEYITEKVELIPEIIPIVSQEFNDYSNLDLDECQKIIETPLSFNRHHSKFIMLLKRKNYVKDYFEGIYLFWQFYKKYSYNYEGLEFEKFYGEALNDSLSFGLEETINQFVQIPIIRPKDKETVFCFACYLLNKEIINEDQDIYDLIGMINNKVISILEDMELDQLENDLLGYKESNDRLTIEDIDMMTGFEFEEFVESLFKKMGYETNRTKKSGDQGIDLIAYNTNNVKFGIQTKCYSNTITNKAVQEVVAGLKYYNLNKGMVITNRYLTSSAMKLSDVNDIIVWDRTTLKEKLDRYFN